MDKKSLNMLDSGLLRLIMSFAVSKLKAFAERKTQQTTISEVCFFLTFFILL